MSTVCIGVATKLQPDNVAKCYQDLKAIADKHACGVFFEIEYQEPFLEHFREASIVFSLSDSFVYDNCEMLMLPDGCFINGRSNPISFKTRMKIILDMAVYLKSYSCCLDFFLGHSGEPIEAYITYMVHQHNMLDVLELFNSDKSPHINMHISVL